MWVLLPEQEFRGPHNVFVPKDFGKTMHEFASVGEFLAALRKHHAQQHARSH